MATFAHDSTSINWSGRILTMRFTVASPAAIGDWWMTAELRDPGSNTPSLPIVTNGQRTLRVRPIAPTAYDDDTTATVELRYLIPYADRVTHNQGPWTVSWGSYLALDDEGNTTATTGTTIAVTDECQVDSTGFMADAVLNDRYHCGEDNVETDAGDSNLTCWLDFETLRATLNHDDQIASITDLSPAANNGTQSSAGDRPTFQKTSNQTPAGYASAAFSGQALQIGSANYDRNTLTATMYVVCKFSSSSIGALLRCGADLVIVNGTGTALYAAGSTAPAVGWALDEWMVVAFKWSSGAGIGNFLGVPGTAGTAQSATSDKLGLGGRHSDGNFGISGYVAEFVMFDVAHSDQEMRERIGGLMEKHEIGPRSIYLDATGGSDSNSGLSESAPRQTVSSANGLRRRGLGDHVYVKAGTTYTSMIVPQRGFLGSTSRMRYESYRVYGTGDRPTFNIANGSSGIARLESSSQGDLIGVHMRGYKITCPTRDPDNGSFVGTGSVNNNGYGIQLVADTKELFIEDMDISWFGEGISSVHDSGFSATNHASARNLIVFNRNIVRNIYKTGADSGDGFAARNQGLYTENRFMDVLLYENVFHECGWSRHATLASTAPATIYSHNVYCGDLNNNGRVDAFGNLLTYGSSHGIQNRPGGDLIANVFYGNAIDGFVTAQEAASEWQHSAVALNSCGLGRSIQNASPSARGWGLSLDNIDAGCLTRNVFNKADATNQIYGGFSSKYDLYTNVVQFRRVSGQRHAFRNNSVVDATSCSHYETGDIDYLRSARNVCRLSGTTGSIVNLDSAAEAIAEIDDNSYDIGGGATEYIREGVARNFANHQSASGTDANSDEHDIAFTQEGRDIGDFEAFLGGDNDAEDYITRCTSRARGAWDHDESPEAATVYIRAGFLATSVGGSPVTNGRIPGNTSGEYRGAYMEPVITVLDGASPIEEYEYSAGGSKSLTIRNDGNAVAFIRSVSISGSDYSISSNPTGSGPIMLAPDGTASVTVVYDGGGGTGTLTIDGDEQTTIALSAVTTSGSGVLLAAMGLL